MYGGKIKFLSNKFDKVFNTKSKECCSVTNLGMVNGAMQSPYFFSMYSGSELKSHMTSGMDGYKFHLCESGRKLCRERLFGKQNKV